MSTILRLIGLTSINNCAQMGTTSPGTVTYCTGSGQVAPFQAAQGGNLYAVIVTRAAITPSNIPTGAPNWQVALTTNKD